MTFTIFTDKDIKPKHQYLEVCKHLYMNESTNCGWKKHKNGDYVSFDIKVLPDGIIKFINDVARGKYSNNDVVKPHVMLRHLLVEFELIDERNPTPFIVLVNDRDNGIEKINIRTTFGRVQLNKYCNVLVNEKEVKNDTGIYYYCGA